MTARSILLIDDEIDLMELFKMALRRLPYQVLTAKDGPTALELLEQEKPALIVLDIAMPQMSGIAVLHKIRSDSRFENTKIMILTAVPNRVTQQDANIADAVLLKPITLKGLEEAVNDLIGGA